VIVRVWSWLDFDFDRVPEEDRSATQFERERGNRIAELDACHKGTAAGTTHADQADMTS